MFAPPFLPPIPIPLPVPFPLPGMPTPGQMMTTVGNHAQAIEQAVGDAIGSVLGNFHGNTPEGKKDVNIQLPDGRGGRITFPEGVITTDQFREFAQAVGQAFQAVRQDVSRLKSVTASVAAQGSQYYQSPDEGGRGGGGIDPLMLILLLKDRDSGGSSSGDGLDTTTLMLLLMGEGGLTGGGGRMDTLTLLLALGKL